MSLAILAPLVILALLFAKRQWGQRLANPKRLPYPPGPRPLPVVGNLFDTPTEYDWLTYSDWAKKYGDVMHVKVLDKHVLILNSFEATNELFEKRSAKYSDKPHMPMLVDLMGWSFALGSLHYGPKWRQYRKMFHQHFYPAATQNYIPIQTQSARQALRKLLEDPDDWMQVIRLTVTSSIVRVVYGFTIQDTNDPYIGNAEKLMGGLAAAGVPGKFLVDTFPVLKHVPSWFPGAGFKHKAKEWKDLLPYFINKPFDDVMARVESGTVIPCVASQLIERMKETKGLENDEAVARNVTAIAYAGGADTSVSTIQTFFLAMVLYPEIQQRAQKQLDDIVGADRLPEFKDIASLPYIEAMVKELLRWQPVTPLASVHCTIEDDEYRGYFIPKGTLVYGNSWQILHDEEAYPDPMSFKPERFLRPDGSLDPGVRDPVVAAFGFSRRICPGRHMAINGTLITVATLLAVFNIEQVCDSNGEPTVKEAQMTSGMLSYPLPFKCRISPRSNASIDLIKRASDEYQ